MKALSMGNGQLHSMGMTEVANPLDCMHDAQAILVGGGTEIKEPIMMSDRKGHNGITEDGRSTTLTAQDKERPVVACGYDSYNQKTTGEVSQTLKSQKGGDDAPRAVTSVVRRLTPLECERLQGMPDDWSRYGVNERGEVYELPDSARYRLQGNGICTPFWRWMLKRISAQYERTPTLGSLFDGQGSFPMLWEGINGAGSAVWSSEIDRHATAVSKYHFPEDQQKGSA